MQAGAECARIASALRACPVTRTPGLPGKSGWHYQGLGHVFTYVLPQRATIPHQ